MKTIYVVAYGSNSDDNPRLHSCMSYFSTEELALQYVERLKELKDEYDIASYNGVLAIRMYPVELDRF